MQLNLIYLLIIITLFGICTSRKSSLYPDQNNDNNDWDEEVQQQQQEFDTDYDNNIYETNEEPKRKSSLSDNADYQYQDPNDEDTYNGQYEDVQEPATTKTRHHYKLSFKKPYYYYNDTNIIPNWECAGDVIPAQDMIRLVPSVPDKAGSIWSLTSNRYDEWQIILSLRVSGRNMHGSQGMGIFYTEHRLKPDAFFGGETTWNGLAVIFDTLNLDSNTNIPTISILYNDGNTTIRSQSDYDKIRKSACVADFRNSPNPIFVKITYENKQLKVEVDLIHGGSDYHECTNDNIELPKDFVFGVTAKTGSDNADDHDIISFDFYQLNPPPKEIKYRPLEEEVLSREGEFKIDEQTLEHIKRVQDELNKDDQKKKDQEKQEKFADAKTVYMTQFRILESVNRILTYVQKPQNKANSDEGPTLEDINNSSEQILLQQQEINESLENLKQQIDNINEFVERNSQKYEYKLNSVESKVNQKVISEISKVLSELRILKEENIKLKESTKVLAKKAKKQPNIWLVVMVSFFLNLLGLYIIFRVLPNSGRGGDLFKTNHYY